METFIVRTEAELRVQRAKLLAKVHMSYEELRDRASIYTLSPRQLAVWHTIEGIDYLLKDSHPDELEP